MISPRTRSLRPDPTPELCHDSQSRGHDSQSRGRAYLPEGCV
eukprot:COSAG01_NODE_19730_length_992_cov_1.062640_2_plen_41_part_01